MTLGRCAMLIRQLPEHAGVISYLSTPACSRGTLKTVCLGDVHILALLTPPLFASSRSSNYSRSAHDHRHRRRRHPLLCHIRGSYHLPHVLHLNEMETGRLSTVGVGVYGKPRPCRMKRNGSNGRTSVGLNTSLIRQRLSESTGSIKCFWLCIV